MRVDGDAKVAQLDRLVRVVDEDVVWLEVGVDDAALGQQLKGEQHLVAKGPHGRNVQAVHAAHLLHQVAQVHPGGAAVRRDGAHETRQK